MMRRLLVYITGLALCLPANAGAAKVQEVISAGGIKAWLVEEHSLPLVAVNVSFEGSGYAYDDEGREGRANLVAAMLMEGAGNMNAREFNEALESRAIVLNTMVDEDLLSVSMETLSEHKETAFSYLSLSLTEPRFDSDAMDRARRQSLALLKQQQQDPDYLLAQGWRKLAFGDHPYSRMQLGNDNSLRRMDRYDLRDFTEDYLTRGNMLVAVVGDITPEELKPMLDKTFGKLPEAYNPDRKVEPVTVAAGDQPIVVEYDIPQTLVAFAAQGLNRNDPDYLAAHIMNHILGGEGALTSKLGVEIRDKRGLAYSVYSYLHPRTHGASWNGGFATRNEEAGTALTVLREALKAFAKDGPSQQEMADAKRYLTGSFVLNMDSNTAIAEFLINMQHFHLGIDYLDKRNAMIEAVSQKDVAAVAKRLIDADKLAIVMVGKPVFSPAAP